MKNLIRAYIYLLKCKIDKKTTFLVKMASVIVLCLLMVFGVTFICGIDYNVVYVFMNKFSLVLMLYVIITILPLRIYYKFIINKEFDMLFMAPISLRSCYAWIYMKQILIIMLFLSGIYISMIPTCMLMNYNIIHHFVIISSMIVSAFNIVIILELLMYRIIGVNLYKGILFFVGIAEIASFFIFQALVDGNLVINVTINHFGNRMVMLAILINIVLLCISYRLFVKAYSYKGFSSRTNFAINKNEKNIFKSKEYKLFIRDFDRIKYVIVTLLIYISTTVVGKNKVDYITLYLINMSFLVVVALQLTLDCISEDKEKKDIYILSNISWKKYIIDKVEFIVIVTGAICIIFDATMFFYHQIAIKEAIVFTFGTAFILAVIPFIYCDKIGQIKIDEKSYTIKKKIKIIGKKSLNIAFDILVICSLAAGVMLIEFEWYMKIIIYFLISILGYLKIKRRIKIAGNISFEEVARM